VGLLGDLFGNSDADRRREAREYFGPPKKWDGERWEYQLVFIRQEPDTKWWTTASGNTKRMVVEILDQNGSDGWELVSFGPYTLPPDPGYHRYEFFAAFKRPLPDS
jgi:hypothetical protein